MNKLQTQMNYEQQIIKKDHEISELEDLIEKKDTQI